MGRRGPIPDPKSGRSKAGRNTRYREAPADTGEVSPPAWLAGEAAGFWAEHAPAVAASGRLRQDQAETFAILCQLAIDCRQLPAQVAADSDALQQVNESLWDIEDQIRDKELAQAFDGEFIELARAVYVTNDERARLKKNINTALGSRIVEEKSYKPYRPAS